jgi:HSP20 family protein
MEIISELYLTQEVFKEVFEMFGQTRWNPFEDVFNFQREADRLFNQFWADVPARSFRPTPNNPFHVQTAEDSWRVEIPMPGIDPANVTLEVAGNTIAVRAEQDGGRSDGATQWEQTLTMPRILNLEGIRATHRHGLLVLTIPLHESVKPRRIQIDGVASDTTKQLTTA